MNIDVPSSIDFHKDSSARQWAKESMIKRPYRQIIFQSIAEEIKAAQCNTVLELGSGPGFLAKAIIKASPNIVYTALDSSKAMHQLAEVHLGKEASHIHFSNASFLEPDWFEGLGVYKAIVTVQSVHEVRHKSKVEKLFKQIRCCIETGGMFLYCDHVCDQAGIQNDQLFMSEEEQAFVLNKTFVSVDRVCRHGTLALWRAICD